MEDSDGCYRRILILLGVACILFSGLLAQLARIQLLDWVEYTRKAVAQRQDQLIGAPSQATFLDRKLKALRAPVAAHYLLVFNRENSAKRIREIQTVFPAVFVKEYRNNRQKSYWVYSKPLSRDQIRAIKKMASPNLQLVEGLTKVNRESSLAWHVLGWGGSGLEGAYQQLLQSSRQSQQLSSVIDGIQKQIPGIGFRINHSHTLTGLVLTLDLRIQKIVEQVVDREKLAGAVVVLDVHSGEILAMTSRPIVNLRNLTESLSSQELPFLNRAVSAYPPGSIFKLVILSAGLDSGKLQPNELFFDPGYYQIGDQKWLCTTSSGQGHQWINLKDALAYSCNSIFIEAAIRLQPQIILEYADKFGLGLPCNIGLRDESWGELPTGIGLSPGEQANLALGQQNILTTPLQIAGIVQTIANNGIRKKPYLVKGYLDDYGHFKNLAFKQAKYVLKPSTARILQQMMSAVTQYGTGTEAQLTVGSAGKTGTAQITNNQTMPDHAWFAGYAPFENPRYVAVVFCEKGVSGGKTAAPIFKEIMEEVTKYIR